MSKRTSRLGLMPAWLEHRRLVEVEAVLLANAAREVMTERFTPTLPGWGKILFTMGCAVGLLGGLIYVLRAVATKGVARTHSVVRVAPLPGLLLVVHLAAFVGLFFLYAYVWGIDPRAPGHMPDLPLPRR